VGENHQPQITALTVICFGSHVRSLPAFDHRHDRFYLGPLTIGVFTKSHLHEPSVIVAGWLVCWPSPLGWNHRTNIAVLPSMAVVRLGVVSRVGKNCC
jgi:hypothetical protein